MSFADGRYHITYNGEIYNFLELRKTLIGRGYQFFTETDTEVVLAAYTEWGANCQERFNGMWAFAIWDESERILFLSRDRFGVKPLYYFQSKSIFGFASELKSFMALPNHLRPEFDLQMVARMKNEEGIKETLLKGVFNLNGGNCLHLAHSGQIKEERWWRTSDHLCRVSRDYDEQVEQYKEILLDACRLRMRSDVPIGTALSGGLDSSSVACAMAAQSDYAGSRDRMSSDWQRAFVASYVGTGHEEAHHAQRVVSAIKADKTMVEVEPGSISPFMIENVIGDFEAIQNAEPSLGPWLLYRAMSQSGTKVSLDGHGGDEALAGYHHYIFPALQDALWPFPDTNRWSDLQRTYASLLLEETPEGLSDKHPSIGEVLRLFLPQEALKQEVKSRLWRYPTLYEMCKATKRSLSRDSSEHAAQLKKAAWLKIKPKIVESVDSPKEYSQFGFLKRQLYKDFHFGSNVTILRNFDRCSMAHGVESRAPFLDWRLVAFSFSLPETSILGGGFTKRVLRDAMRGLLPEEIRTRTGKMGFASPMRAWLAGDLKEFVMDHVNSEAFLASEVWNGQLLRDHVADCFRSRNINSAVLVWKYIQADILMRKFSQMESSS